MKFVFRRFISALHAVATLVTGSRSVVRSVAMLATRGVASVVSTCLFLGASLPAIAQAQTQSHACIDSFSGKHAPTAQDLWQESPFVPGTKYTALSRPVSAELFEAIVKTTEKLVNVCGPGCLMIGLGRSPTPLIAQAQIMNQYAISMPLSDFRPLLGFNETSSSIPKFPEPYNSPQLSQMFHELSAAEEEILFKHFDAFIGSRMKGLSRLLLIDFSQSGASLYATQRYLEKWLATKASSADEKLPELKSVSIGEKSYESYANQMQDIWRVSSFRLNLSPTSPLVREFNEAKFDGWSEYTSYELGGRYSENVASKNGNSTHPYFLLRNSLAIMNLARTNDRSQVPDGTKLPKDVFWDLEARGPRNRTTGAAVELKFSN